jgi:hypothetical protein
MLSDGEKCRKQLVKEILIGTTSSGIWHELRDIYSICCWNAATYEWKVHHGIIEIISFVVKYLYLWYLLFVNLINKEVTSCMMFQVSKCT